MQVKYLDSFATLDLEKSNNKTTISVAENDYYTLNDLHVNNGYNNYAQSGCYTHYDSGYDNHYDSGCDDFVNSGCDDIVDSGCDNHTNTDCYVQYDNCSVNPYTAHGEYNAGCYTHTDTGCNTHTESGCNTHSDSGCDTHSNSGYDNHTNSGCATHVNYTDNFAPAVSGVITPAAGAFNLAVPLAWQAATDQLDEGSATPDTILYELKFCYKGPTDSDFGVWQDLVTISDNHSVTTYVWDTSLEPAGVYKISVIAWDGAEYSATSLISDEFIIAHYQAPSWSTIINDDDNAFQKIAMDEVRTEVNAARLEYSVANPTIAFTDETIVANFTPIKTTHILELRSGVLAARQNAGLGSSYGWSNAALTVGSSKVKGIDLKEIRNNLEDISG